MLLTPFQTQLHDSILLFQLLLQKEDAKLSNLVVIFSKSDLLAEKLQTIPFEKHCRDYRGPPNDAGCVRAFIRNKFVDMAMKNGRKIQVYTANLTKTESVKPIMEDILNRSWQHRLKMDRLRHSFS